MPRKAVNWSSGDQSPGTFQSENTERENENFHPTVKPTELMQYLIRLVTPKGGRCSTRSWAAARPARRAMREDMNFVGIELDPAYIEIAKRRIVGVAPLFAEVQA
jgi:DNA modification methylase